MIETPQITRRHALLLGATGAMAALLAACGGAAAPASSVPASPSAAASAKPAASASTAGAAAASAKPAAPASAAASGKPAASPAGSPPAASGQLTPMKLSYLSQTGAGSATLWTAKEGGFLTKYGIDGELDYLPPAQLTQAVIAGSIDLGQGSSANVATAVAEGADLVMIGCNVQGAIYTIVGNKSLAGGGLAGLRGKRISGGASASTGELTVRQVMQEQGMQAGTDYSLVPFPQDAGAMAALQQGSIDAAIFSEPSTSVAISQGNVVIYDQKTSGVKNVGGPLLVTHKYLASHQELLKRFLMADLDAMHLIKTDPAKAASYTSKYMQVSQDVGTAAMKNQGELMDGYLSIPLQSLAEQMKVAAATNPKVANLKPEQLVDTTLLDQILATDFMTKLYNGSPPPRPS